MSSANRVLLLFFQSRLFFFLFLLWLLWLGLPKLCWVVVVRVGLLVLFLILKVIIQLPSHVWLFATPWTAARQASLSLTISWICSSSCPLHQWCCPSISFSDTLFSFCPQSFPASETFPMHQLFTSDDQNTEVSALISVLPMSIDGWFPLRLTLEIFGLMSSLSKGLSVLSSRF